MAEKRHTRTGNVFGRGEVFNRFLPPPRRIRAVKNNRGTCHGHVPRFTRTKRLAHEIRGHFYAYSDVFMRIFSIFQPQCCRSNCSSCLHLQENDDIVRAAQSARVNAILLPFGEPKSYV